MRLDLVVRDLNIPSLVIVNGYFAGGEEDVCSLDFWSVPGDDTPSGCLNGFPA